MLKQLVRISCILLFASVSMAQRSQFISINGAKLTGVREMYRAGSENVVKQVESLVKEADKSLRRDPVTVTSKKQTPPSGDKHDYMSLAPYWWPDPKSKDGLPYIRRDGEVNPEREDFTDRDNFGTMRSNVSSLALAYFLSGKEEYAAHAARFLRTWFVDSTTRMNPNMNFAEAVKGRNSGRGSGIIEAHGFPSVLDAVIMLKGSKAWSASDESTLRTWCSEYLNWLRTSPNGLDEEDSENNHGTWYDVQVASLALFVGQKDTAQQILRAACTRRIASQVEPDGKQPRELERTRAMGYSTFNLLAMTTLATIGSNAGVDLWKFTTKDGRSIRKALDWMIPYYSGEKRWDYKQISEWKSDDAVKLLVMASVHYGSACTALAEKISTSKSELTRLQVLY